MELKNEVTNNSGLETIARVGQSFCLPAAFDTLSWYGKGPWETYADRKDAAFTGFYTSSVAEQHVPFVVPCECGGHEDTRFAVLSDGTHTVQIVGSDDFHFSALPYSMAEYRKAAYEEELPEHTTGTWLILDAAHAGLGGDTGWTKNIHPEYRVCKEDIAIRSVSISHKRKKSANCLFFGRQTADFICSFAAIMKSFASQKENCTRLKHFLRTGAAIILPVLFSSVNNKYLTIYKEWCRVKVSKEFHRIGCNSVHYPIRKEEVFMMKELKPIKEGKVREIYDNGDSLIMVATDRISCFDVILNNVVTKKVPF